MDPLSSFFCHSVDAVFFLPLPTIIISSSFFFIVFVFFFFSALSEVYAAAKTRLST